MDEIYKPSYVDGIYDQDYPARVEEVMFQKPRDIEELELGLQLILIAS